MLPWLKTDKFIINWKNIFLDTLWTREGNYLKETRNPSKKGPLDFDFLSDFQKY